MPQTDTYEWTIKSNTGITSGTFFDGTPWIVDNGGLTLTNVTPAGITTSIHPEGSTFTGETMITVLNPDFGLFIPASQGITGDPANVSTTKTYATGPSAGDEVSQSRVLSPFDFRAGTFTNGGTGNVGVGFDSTQGLTFPGEYKLSAGDMIVTNYGYTGDITTDDFNKPWTESYGCLTVLASAPGASAFRPPVNWDPNDKVNRPVFYENDTFSDDLFTYPNYSISGASAWTDTYIAYDPTDSDINLDRPGTITPFFAGRDTSNARGTLKIQSCIDDEYGNNQAIAEDAMMLSVFDPNVAGATRDIFRRTVAQRGIDTWGQIGSMGAAIKPNGGHNPEYHPRVFFAWCVTGATAMLDFLNLTAYGATASGTRLNRQQKPGEPFGLGDYNADIHEGAFVSFGNQMCSFRHFDVPVVSQGSTANENWVRLSRPASTTEYAGTGKTGYAPIWLSTSPTANAGRNWGFCNNNKYVGNQGEDSQIISGYVRLKGTSGGAGYTATSRIIWTDWYNQSGDLTTSAEDKRNPYEARFWLQDDVVPTSGTITEVDLCDALPETRSTHMSRHITYTLSNFTAESAIQAYTYSTMANLLSAWKLVQAKGGSGSVPFWGARKAQHAEYMAGDIRGKQQLLSNWSGTYNWGSADPKDSLYYALMRQGPGSGVTLPYTPYEYINGYAPTTPGTTAEMWNAGYTLSASGTWEELGFDLDRIRVWTTMRTNNNSNAYYRYTEFGGTGGGATGTTFTDGVQWTVASYKTDGSLSVRVRSNGGVTWGMFNRNDWSVWAWTRGLTGPIGLTLESTDATNDDNTSWNSYYVPVNPVTSMDSAYPPPTDSGTTILWAETASESPTTITLTDPFNGTDKVITDAGFAVGMKVSYLTLSGSKSAGAGTELQYYDHGTSFWKDVPNLTWSGNDFTATDVPFTASPVTDWTAQSGGTGAWWNVQIRDKDNTGVTAESSNRFRPGVVFASLSQSEREHMWYREAMDGTAKVLDDNHMQVLWYNQSNKAGISWASMPTQLERKFITQTNYETNSSSDPSRTPIVAAANLFKRIIPDYPVMMVDHQWTGTSRTEMGYAGATGRDWRQVVYTTEWLRQRNSYIGLQDECWFNSDAGKSNNLFSRTAPFYMGVYYDNSKYVLGSGSTADQSGGETWDHCFFDLSEAGSTTGRGIYRPDRTQISIMGPIPTNTQSVSGTGFSGGAVWAGISADIFRINAETQLINNYDVGYTGPSAGGTWETDNIPTATNYRRCTQSLGFVFDDSTATNPWREITKAWTWDTALNLYGDWKTGNYYSDLSHPAKGGDISVSPYQLDVNALHGNILTAQYMAMSVAKALVVGGGVTATMELPVPVISLTNVSSDGTRLTFRATDLDGSTLPSGYDLTTYREGATGIHKGSARDIASGVTLGTGSLAGLLPPQRDKPEVVGFEVYRGGTPNAKNLEVDVRGLAYAEAPSESYWQNYMGPSAGYSVTFDGPECTVTYNVPLENGDTVRYGWGSMGNVGQQYDIRDKVHMDMLVVSVPGLSLPSELGTNTAAGLTGQPFDSMAGLPVCRYPRTPIWSITRGASGTKLNAHNFTTINTNLLNTLVEGSSGPAVWSAFVGYDEVGNTTDNPQLNYRYPARFITPIISEFEGNEEIRVLAHPYGGWATGGNQPNGVDKVEFYLNGGPAVLGTKTKDVVTGQENIWSVRMPSGLSADITEIRAKVFPKIGKVNVLQGTGYKTELEARTLYGAKTLDDPPYTYVGYEEGIYPNRRGCIKETGLTTYYISPSGNDSNDGLSSGAAKLTPQSVYTAAGNSKVKINNSAYSKANALHVSGYIRDDASYAHTDHLPIIEGGVIFWNNGNTTTGTNGIGCIFKDVDFRANTSVKSDSLNHKSIGEARYVWIDCDLGIDAKADSHGGQFGEVEDQANSGSLPGLRVELKQVGEGSPTFFYGCDFRHATSSTGREVVDTVYCLPPTQNDVCNAQLLYNVKCSDIAAIIYPYGSGAKDVTSFVPKGSARSYTAIGYTAGITYQERNVRTILDTFYATLGTSAGVSGSPYTGVTVGSETFGGKALWTVIDPNATMISAYEQIPSVGFYPDWTFALRRTGLPWDRPSIDLGYFTGITTATNPTQYAGGTAHRGFVANGGRATARDPHFDITQTFWESDRGGTATDGSVWNTMVVDLYVSGYSNVFQGMFFADASRIDESSFWDIDLQIDTSVEGSAAMMSAMGGHSGEQNYIHFGPRVQNTIGQLKTIWNANDNMPAPQKDLFFYETDGWKFPTVVEDSAGVASSVYDWNTAPTSYLTAVGISGAINSWQVTDNPSTLSRYAVFRGFQVGGTLDGSIDGGGVRYVTPGACGDLTGPLGFLGGYAQNNSSYSLLGWGSSQYRFGISGDGNETGVITDPVSGVTYQAWDGTGFPDQDEIRATTVWLSNNNWRMLAGMTYNVGSTYEKYFEWIINDYEPGVTWTGLNIQNGYAQLSSSAVRSKIRDTDSTFPQAYHAAASTSFTYEMVPMQMTYYVEKDTSL